MYPTSTSSTGRNPAILDVSELPVDPSARRMRERYIAARFLQFPEPAQALRNTPGVMRCARQLLDDDQPSLAAELLQLALEVDGAQRPIWLCLIELAYLGNDPATFGELSDIFRRRFADDEALPTIDAMGNRMLPNDPQFVHASHLVILPDWSTPDSAMRDESRQRKLHAALVDAMAFHSAR